MRQPNLQREHAELLLRKASEDEALLDEVLNSPHISDEVFGFHCQQAAEKLLKAVLAFRGVVYRRTHDLTELIALLQQHGIALPTNLEEVDSFIPYAVEYRYQEWPEEEEAIDREVARELLRDLRKWAEAQIG